MEISFFGNSPAAQPLRNFYEQDIEIIADCR